MIQSEPVRASSIKAFKEKSKGNFLFEYCLSRISYEKRPSETWFLEKKQDSSGKPNWNGLMVRC